MWQRLKKWFNLADEQMLPAGRVAANGTRCVQCGICGYNCPVGIPVRDYARRGRDVTDPTCIACGQCIEVCPRGTLRWETEDPMAEVDLLSMAAGD